MNKSTNLMLALRHGVASAKHTRFGWLQLCVLERETDHALSLHDKIQLALFGPVRTMCGYTTASCDQKTSGLKYPGSIISGELFGPGMGWLVLTQERNALPDL